MIKIIHASYFVYVVCSGERHEGHSPLGVYSSIDGAKKSRKRIKFHRVHSHLWKGNKNFVDEVYIYKFQVS